MQIRTVLNRAVKYIVDYGMERRDLSGVTAIGVDDRQFASRRCPAPRGLAPRSDGRNWNV